MFSTSKLMAKHGVKAVFSDRFGGVSPKPFDGLNLGFGLGDLPSNVMQNMQMLCAQTEMPMPHQAQQVHGVDVLFCEGEGKAHDVEADIVISCFALNANVSLAVRTADCVPILLADYQAKVIAAVHAGWKGTVKQVVQEAVCLMCEKGADQGSIIASLGPSIGQCCFKVNDDVARQLQNTCGESVVKCQGQQLYADLVKTNVLQLVSTGISQENIEVLPVCTSCHQQPEYFSYRRDKGQTGRQLAMISMS